MAIQDDKDDKSKQSKEVKAGDAKAVKDDKKEADLSEEDIELKKNLEILVSKVVGSDTAEQKLALESIRTEIKTATSSMTSVPKPLKFLRAHYDELKLKFEDVLDSDVKAELADVISLLATTKPVKDGPKDALKFRLLGTRGDLGSWGHEYLRHLAGELAEEYNSREAHDDDAVEDLLYLVNQMVPFHMTHNAEPEAVDLLLEVERLELITDFVDDKNYARTCLYLVSCCNYLQEPDDVIVLRTAYKIYKKMGKYNDAMRVALQINDQALIEDTFAECTDELEKKQLGYLLARQGVNINLEEGTGAVEDEAIREILREIISNSKLSEHFLSLARDLDVMEPKTPEDVYKTHLTDRAPSGSAVDSAKQNLASTFVNAFVNAAFGKDKLVTVEQEQDQTHWVHKNKDHGKISATASLGLITMWDVEGGLPQIDKYLYSKDDNLIAGALLAIGIINCCVQNEHDPAIALISEYLTHSDTSVKMCAILGLGLAYAGTHREDVQELLVPIVQDLEGSIEVAGFAALSLGLVFATTCSDAVASAILNALMSRGQTELTTPFARLLCLGLALLFLAKQERVEAIVEIAKTLNDQISSFCQVALESLAYAGTGNVLKVQELLSVCGEHIEAEEFASWKAAQQGPAVLGLALIAMAEPLGGQMAQRVLEHLLQYGDPPVRRAVPLAMALLNVSNPEMMAMDTLGRLSHDADPEVAQAAVLALGLIGAGTNNARLAGLLRNLSSYYYKDPSLLYVVRIAQGLVHMGKGLMTLSPTHTDKQLLSGVGLAGLLSVLYSCLDMKATILGKYHYILYVLATAMKPRMFMTLDEAGAPLPVPVRVGQAVDVVAQAGRPKSITGFQTHTTPVLMGAGERAELATDKYLPLSSVLEGLVILRPNPDYVEVVE